MDSTAIEKLCPQGFDIYAEWVTATKALVACERHDTQAHHQAEQLARAFYRHKNGGTTYGNGIVSTVPFCPVCWDAWYGSIARYEREMKEGAK